MKPNIKTMQIGSKKIETEVQLSSEKMCAELAAARKNLRKVNDNFMTNNVLLKLIDKLVECLFIKDATESTDTAFDYLFAAEAHYEELPKSSNEVSKENHRILYDIREVIDHLSDLVNSVPPPQSGCDLSESKADFCPTIKQEDTVSYCFADCISATASHSTIYFLLVIFIDNPIFI